MDTTNVFPFNDLSDFEFLCTAVDHDLDSSEYDMNSVFLK